MDGLPNQLRILVDEASREKLSKDYFWYSPVLDKKLQGKIADVVALPESEEEIVAILSMACRNRIPVTVRGAGTGNYGQAVPLQGGIVLDLSGLNRILEIEEGYARIQCGVRLGALDKKVREQGQDLRIYPSTYVKATIGGFVGGGSGGIGSVTWGNLWDGNVLEAIVYTMEEIPRRLVVRGEELLNYIHSYGTTGIIVELTIPLSPLTAWSQSIVSFESFDMAMRFGEALAKDMSIAKREAGVMEWPIPSFFKPLAKALTPEMHAVLVETADGTQSALAELAQQFEGKIVHHIEASQYRKSIGLSDFAWNHTTLWALKADSSLTYLQAEFSKDSYLEQIKQIDELFDSEVMHHFEWIREGGEVKPMWLPVIRYSNEDRLYEIIRYCESIGIIIFDPHTWLLNDDSRGEVNGMVGCKRVNDPLGLLNPGKMIY